MPDRYFVSYSVRFEAYVEVAEGGNLADEIHNIDIPVGGENNSEYVEGSFKIVSVEDPNGKEINLHKIS